MKRNITHVFLALATGSVLNAQTLFQESFTSPFNPTSAGWNVQNLSAVANPTLNWFQGNGSVFPANSGGPNDYFASNYNSTSSSAPATISDWLITPVVNLFNGAIVQFATRTEVNPASFPDRLEVYLSTAGAGTNVGTTPTSLGTFSTLLVSVNPSLTTTGYPDVWTVYSATISGLSGTTPSRIGFRYFVTNGGGASSAVNSDFIGIDDVKITGACNASVQSYTVCSGTSVTLTANGVGANGTYSWTPTAGSSSAIVVNPTSTTIYTLNYTSNNATCTAVMSTVAIGSNLTVSVSASSPSICSGDQVTLTAQAPATTYSWSSGGTGTTTTVSPNSTTTYTVGALNGLCYGINTVVVTVFANPTINITSASTLVCMSSATTVTLGANGATSYVWLVDTNIVFAPTLTYTLAAPSSSTPASFTQTFDVFGVDVNGCAGQAELLITFDKAPTVIASAVKPIICAGSEKTTLNASGASSYSWSSGGSTSAISFSNATAGTYTVGVTGSGADGCKGFAVATVTVDACLGITKVDENTADIRIFPNPFASELKIANVDGRIEVYNTLGSLVLSEVSNGSTTINTTQLAKGVYFVKAFDSDNNIIRSERIIKN